MAVVLPSTDYYLGVPAFPADCGITSMLNVPVSSKTVIFSHDSEQNVCLSRVSDEMAS
jgi:hypothetical protein